jgi:hypothetical protein
MASGRERAAVAIGQQHFENRILIFYFIEICGCWIVR